MMNNGTWKIGKYSFEWDYIEHEGCYLYCNVTGWSGHFESVAEAREYAEEVAKNYNKIPERLSKV
jgi:hypothetical protein